MFPLQTSVLPVLYKCVLVTDMCIICRSTNVLSLQTSVLSAGVKCHNYIHMYYLQVYVQVFSLQAHFTPALSEGVKCRNYRYLYYLKVYQFYHYRHLHYLQV